MREDMRVGALESWTGLSRRVVCTLSRFGGPMLVCCRGVYGGDGAE